MWAEGESEGSYCLARLDTVIFRFYLFQSEMTPQDPDPTPWNTSDTLKKPEKMRGSATRVLLGGAVCLLTLNISQLELAFHFFFPGGEAGRVLVLSKPPQSCP